MATHVDEVTQELRERILSGAYGANDRLAETAVADELGGSRTLARLALAALEQEGLTLREPNRGYRVRGFTLDEVTDAILVRGELEGMAARTVAERGLSDESDNKLTQLLNDMDDLIDKGFRLLDSQARWLDLNADFHAAIIAASGNRALRDSIQQLSRLPLVASRAVVFDQSDVARSLSSIRRAHEDHHAVVDAMRCREGSRAAATMREHARRSSLNKRMSIDAMKGGLLGPKLPGLDLVDC